MKFRHGVATLGKKQCRPVLAGRLTCGQNLPGTVLTHSRPNLDFPLQIDTISWETSNLHME